MEKENVALDYPSQLTSSSVLSEKSTTTAMDSISKLPCVWHLPDSYELENLRGKPGTIYRPNLISQENTSPSMQTDQSLFILPSSKTDPYGKGTAIHLSQANSTLCPVQALTTLFCKQSKLPNDPLFSRTLSSFNRAYIVDKIKELLLRAGISNSNFSGHSLRKGAAVTAAANGISKENIKLLDRWRSDAVDIYINELSEKDHIKKLLQLNAQLHYKTTLSYPTKTQLFSSPKLSALSALNNTHQRSTLPWQERN